MRNCIRKISVLALALIMLISASSCAFIGMDAMMGSGSSEDYMTREEVEQLLDGVEKNVTLQGGDTVNIGNITSNYDKNLLAASRGLLSAVSIAATFNVTYTYQGGYGGFPSVSNQQTTSYGSGVIYKLDKTHGDAYVITNHHVVYEAASTTSNKISNDIKVFLYGQEYADYAIRAEYVGGSENYDIAVLRIKNSEILMKSNAVQATFANSDDVSVLDTAIAIGNPAAEGISATVGVVNVESEEIKLAKESGSGYVNLRVMRTDAAVNSGNSGGGLFNDRGEIIGIVNAKTADSDVENIGYAIPANVAKNVAENILYYDSLDSASDSVRRVMVGITVSVGEAYTVYDKETGKVHKMERVVVKELSSGGAAESVLQVGDVINSVVIDGITYQVNRTFCVVDAMLNARKSSEKVSTVVFNITRDGKDIQVNFDISQIQLADY